VHALVLAGTDLYAGGLFTSIGAQPRNRIAKLSTTGTGAADPAWHPDAEGGGAFALALHGTTLYAGGSFTNIGGIPFGRLARIQKSNKEIDPTWNPNANNTVLAIAVDGGDVYVGGDFTQVGGQGRNRIAKLSASGAGAADATWNPNANNSVFAIAVSGSDVFVGGRFTNIGGQARNQIAKM
ncbi:MAG: hypothetical protein RMJ44_12575, partial [Cytophagales bacterium]|nr:hypothetical protein [Cytophagales bacterium]